MKELIKALMILNRYGNPVYPTRCEHDMLIVCISPKVVTAEDCTTLAEMGFLVDKEGDCFYSFRYGTD
jgi:hypothetical protein